MNIHSFTSICYRFSECEYLFTCSGGSEHVACYLHVLQHTDLEQGDLDDAREFCLLMWKCKETEFRGGHLGFLAAILD